MPATGEVAPARILVTVRAMVPVAGMPPKNGTTALAMPWAISSWLGSCLGRPLSWSATRAHSRDSMAPSAVMVSVGVTSSLTVSQEKSGSANTGSPCGMPPKRVPMVSTGHCSAQASRLRVSRATTGPGMRAPTTAALRTSGSSSVGRWGERTPQIFGHTYSPTTQARPRPSA